MTVRSPYYQARTDKYIVLYKAGKIFSEPMKVKQEEIQKWRDDFKGTKFKVEVVSTKKANAIRYRFNHFGGDPDYRERIIGRVKLEPLYPASCDMGKAGKLKYQRANDEQ